jgi:hypothetical protein
MSLAKVDNGVSHWYASFAEGEGFKAPYVKDCDAKDLTNKVE